MVIGDGYPVLGEIRPHCDHPMLPWQITPDGAGARGRLFALAMVRPRSLGDLAKTGETFRAVGPPRRSNLRIVRWRPAMSEPRASSRPWKWWN